MKTKDMIQLGVPPGPALAAAHDFVKEFIERGGDGSQLETEIFDIVANPTAHFGDELRAPLARSAQHRR